MQWIVSKWLSEWGFCKGGDCLWNSGSRRLAIFNIITVCWLIYTGQHWYRLFSFSDIDTSCFYCFTISVLSCVLDFDNRPGSVSLITLLRVHWLKCSSLVCDLSILDWRNRRVKNLVIFAKLTCVSCQTVEIKPLPELGVWLIACQNVLAAGNFSAYSQ